MINMFLAAESSNSSWIILVVLAVMLVGTMLLSIIPQKKRQKKAQEMMAGIKVGTKIKTIGGFIGTIKMIDNAQNTFVIDISANGDGSALVTIDKGAVYTVMNPVTEGSVDGAATDANATAEAAPTSNAPVAADDVVEDAQAAEKKAAKSKKKGAKAKEETAEAQDEVSATVEQSESSDTTGIDGDNKYLEF